VAGAERILVAMGKKTLELTPSPAARTEILQKILGRSGTLRAPALRRGNTFFIGYNDELYDRLTRA
jgi:hypothetical protein